MSVCHSLFTSPGTVAESCRCSSRVVSHHPRLLLPLICRSLHLSSQLSSSKSSSSKSKRSVSSIPVTNLLVGRSPRFLTFFKRDTCTTGQNLCPLRSGNSSSNAKPSTRRLMRNSPCHRIDSFFFSPGFTFSMNSHTCSPSSNLVSSDASLSSSF